ncbi:hybrid sensor histidine kinase/response regulator [Desulfatirhabdium butyrativorans]|uniref:hybrid sensor histidine kinase/response regulator n=1 Tax=Desulfatirhabdium butyrativorans TaxID=340467 RepID=UPI0004010185|nr:ATP-binding protein [Desulfatirhabdium butyrativorans]
MDLPHHMRLKINAVILTVCCIVAAFIFSIWYPLEQRRVQTHQEHIRSLLHAVFLQKRDEMANEIFAGQKAAIEASIAEIRKVPGIADVRLYDLNGELIAASGSPKPFSISAAERENLIRAPVLKFEELDDEKALARYESVVESLGEQVGFIHIEYDMSNVMLERRKAIGLMLGLLLVLLAIVSVLMNFLLSRWVLKPLAAFVQAIQGIDFESLDQRIPISSRDEIGKLALTFNQMLQRLQQQKLEVVRAIDSRDEALGKLQQTYCELAMMNERLEKRVQERTEVLQKINQRLSAEIDQKEKALQKIEELNERLIRSKKMETLGLLAGGVAHDLNNVLGGIVTYPELLLMDHSLSPTVRKSVDVIHRSGIKAAAIVQDLLTLTRRGVINSLPLNLNDMVSEYLLSPEHEKLLSFHPDIQVDFRPETDLKNILGSAIHLKKTVMNLVSNAAEAMPDGGTISIHTRNCRVESPMPLYELIPEGDYVLLEITDTGIGISKDDISRIFEPFYTKKIMGRSGTGLGMAVVWGTMRDHDGFIDIKSQEGQGTTFFLYFPQTEVKVADMKQQLPMESYVGNGERILVVDDIEEQREIAASLLNKLGYRVETAASGEEALLRLSDTPFDLVVLDMIMDPGMDGLETYRAMIALRPGQKAIIASGFAENSRVKEAQALGAGAYIRKPYTIEKMGLAVKQAISAKLKVH